MIKKKNSYIGNKNENWKLKRMRNKKNNNMDNNNIEIY